MKCLLIGGSRNGTIHPGIEPGWESVTLPRVVGGAIEYERYTRRDAGLFAAEQMSDAVANIIFMTSVP